MKRIGLLKKGVSNILRDITTISECFKNINDSFFLVREGNKFAAYCGTLQDITFNAEESENLEVIAFVPAINPKDLGDTNFCKEYGLKYPYLGGSMAHGIASVKMCEELGKSGMMGFFGSAGLSPQEVSESIDRLFAALPEQPFGVNLIHSPNDPSLEKAIADLLIRKKVRLIEASAYLNITLPLVRYRVHGIYQDQNGEIIAPNRIIGKISRIEVATKFFSPPPDKLLQELVGMGEITSQQAELASKIPLAQDITAEADSGGHTDNRPAITLIPTIIALRNRMQQKYSYKQQLRVGAAGGIATPYSAAAAFSMGAAYIMLGSVHQSCVESGLSQIGREMLCQAQQADTCMAPAGDMFEMGVTVQVLKRGTMFPMRAIKLGELYKAYKSLDEIPATERGMLEKNIFQKSIEEVWNETKQYFSERDPNQIITAEKDPKHKMALVFRWYLGQSPRWAVKGDPTRKIDYQIWCGPAIGAFNEWVKGSEYEPPHGRRIIPIAQNILYGAAVVLRHQIARAQGAILPDEIYELKPLSSDKVEQFFEEK